MPAQGVGLSADERLVVLARVCHEAARAFCAATGDPPLPAWDEAPQWQRVSTYDSVAYLLGNPDAGDSLLHDYWMKGKLADGWTRGETKDSEARTHPCLVPFAELPPRQRAKDTLYRAVVLALRDLP